MLPLEVLARDNMNPLKISILVGVGLIACGGHGMAQVTAGIHEVEVTTLAPARSSVLIRQPLSPLRPSSRAWDARSLAPRSVQEAGQITGVALDVQRQPLSNHAVRLRSESGVVAMTNTDAEGRFSFPALSPGRYVVSVLIDDQVVATSGSRDMCGHHNRAIAVGTARFRD